MKLLCVLSLLAVATATVDYTGYAVYRVHGADPGWLTRLGQDDNFDLWHEGGVNQPADVMAHPAKQRDLELSFQALGLQYTVTIPDVQQHIEASKVVDKVQKPESNFTDYMTYNQIEQWLDYAVASCGSRCTQYDAGLSYEGRDMHVIKVSTGAGKPALWVDGGIHAREWIAHHTALYILDRLVFDYGGVDPEVDEILSIYDVYVLPVVNPDGYVYTWTDDRLWRKTRHPHDESDNNPCVGVDCNRNYDYMWMTVGASDQPCDDTFAGPIAHSDPESRNQRDFMFQYTGNWVSFITLHTYGQLWMAPWGYTYDPPATYDELMRVANRGALALRAVHGTQYEVGSASEILYRSSGTSRDWAYGHAQTSIPYVYTLELRDENSFVLPPSEILPTGQETWAGWKEHVFAIIDGP